MTLNCSIVHEDEGLPCNTPAIHGRPNCKYQLRIIPVRDILLAGGSVAAELEQHKADLRCTLICARQGPMSHVTIGVVEDITRQYSTRLERDALKRIRIGYAEAGYE